MSGVDRPLLGYLGGMFVLGTAIFGMLLWLFLSRIPAFTDAFVRDPVGALQSYPIAVLFVVGILAGTLLLVGLIVGFGARYGPEETPKQ